MVTGGLIDESLYVEALEAGAGAVVAGTYTLTPKSTHPPPYIARYSYGYVNAYGLRRAVRSAEGFILKVLSTADRVRGKAICSFIEETPNAAAEGLKYLEGLGATP